MSCLGLKKLPVDDEFTAFISVYPSIIMGDSELHERESSREREGNKLRFSV